MLSAVLGIAGSLAVPTAAQRSAALPTAQVIATAQFGNLAVENNEISSTVNFLSPNTLALVLCENNIFSSCPLVVLEVADGTIHVLAQTESVPRGAKVYRSEGGFILGPNRFGQSAHLYSADLSTHEEIPDPRYVSSTGRTIAVLTRRSGSASPDSEAWAIYAIHPAPLPAIEKVRAVTGDLQAVSDDELVIRVNDTIRTETLDGKVLGAFAVKPRSKERAVVQFAGQDRLYASAWHHDRIIDVNGKELLKLRAPSGWGFDRFSTDGTRLVYDHYTQSFLKAVGQDAFAVATLGVGAVDEDDNREAIRVLDTTTGNSCFDWKTSKHLIDTRDHADISPDGKLIAITTGGTLTVYRLPDDCSQK